jgi:hypothetical protein
MRSWDSKLAAMIAIVLALAAWLGKDAAISTWLRMTGARVSQGGATAAFSGKPVVMMSVHGVPEDAVAPEAGLYHVLVIFPADSVTWVTSDQGGGVIATTHDEWQTWSRFAGDGEPVALHRSLDSRYNALLNRVSIRGRDYPLAHGNLFVARFGNGGRVDVIQLTRTIPATNPYTVIEAFRAALPGDAVLRDLYRYPKAPCPRRAPAAARGNEA